MPELTELRSRWFLDFNAPGAAFPPISRHQGTHVKPYTDGNRVTPLIDGQSYMKEWHTAILAMTGQPDHAVYHAAWRLEDVHTLGQSNPASNALLMLAAANASGVAVYPLICRNVLTFYYNNPTLKALRAAGVSNACLDNRFPPRGSNHQKFVCLKTTANPQVILGSIDISKTRWDRPAHMANDPERPPNSLGKPTHDTGVRVEGPAVADLEWSFIERWNDPTRKLGLIPLLPSLPLITAPVSSPGPVGSHSIQVLHTYGQTSTMFGYSWSPVGEFTAWAAYLNAVQKAAKYVYIEDQYFLSFDYPPCYLRTGKARDSDIVYQLGEALKRGVKVAVLVPSNAEDALYPYQKYQRDLGVNYLKLIASAHGGNFVVASPHNGTSWIYVHSKLMICDDEFVLIGSANIGQRSMTHDSELQIGVVDGAGQFARDFRKKLWAEHLQRPEQELDDPGTAFGTFKNDVTNKHGRVRPYDAQSSMPYNHDGMIRSVIDPYAGPPR